MGTPAGLSRTAGVRAPVPVVLAAASGDARGCDALAAALAVSASDEHRAALLVEVGHSGARRPTLLASPAARECESRLGGTGAGAAARGLVCQLAAGNGEEGLDRAAEAAAEVPESRGCIVRVEASLWQAALEHPQLRPGAAMLRAELPRDRSLAALAVRDLRSRGLAVRIAPRPLGWATARRALAGVRLGGSDGARLRRWSSLLLVDGQALPLLLGAIALLMVVVFAIVSIAGALTGKGRLQRAADLSALSAARSMRDDVPRVTAPPLLPNGAPNPAHIDRAVYLARARGAGLEAAQANGTDRRRVRITFPGAAAFPPLRVRVDIRADLLPMGRQPRGRGEVDVYAVAEAAPPAGAGAPLPETAAGGGYSGPLVYRQGEGMRPDVARAFDRMSAAAARAGVALIVNSGYRSDAEQAQLFAQHPDPTWVAPPGKSLHRCATELDLGPPSAYGWLVANAKRFGFAQRYSWEVWHYGYVAGPPPCSATGGPDGSAASQGLPAFVPARFRDSIERSAARWNVSAALLAAQLMAESGFDPYAVSPVGAQGIAQFMPGTAAAYGLEDPFDADRAIDTQAHLMSNLLRQFGSVRLALAAYNAGSGAVAACNCVPAYPETLAYVAHILALLDGSGAMLSPPFEVRLVA
jgi:hypothetical protein